MVLAFKRNKHSVVESHPNKLGHRILRVLPHRTRQPSRLHNRLERLSTQNRAGSHYRYYLHRVRRILFKRAVRVQVPHQFSIPSRRRLFCIQKIDVPILFRLQVPFRGFRGKTNGITLLAMTPCF